MSCSACQPTTAQLASGVPRRCFRAGQRAPPRPPAPRRAIIAAATEQDGAQVLVEVTRRIRDLGRKGRPREAVEELAQIASMGIQPDVVAATALVDACARSGKAEMAAEIFQELFGGNMLQPDEVACAVLLRAWGECNPPRWSAIASLLNRMEREFSITPSTGGWLARGWLRYSGGCSWVWCSMVGGLQPGVCR